MILGGILHHLVELRVEIGGHVGAPFLRSKKAVCVYFGRSSCIPFAGAAFREIVLRMSVDQASPYFSSIRIPAKKSAKAS
jgi:hypothetical protein